MTTDRKPIRVERPVNSYRAATSRERGTTQ